ncbi:MAG: hypothetical protein AB200_02170 [Parcubacteria bacterium C7867-005]|nr:MAG: hypothetical protein AB200_02170 [Parcubacteria bacterium C7867-005]
MLVEVTWHGNTIYRVLVGPSSSQKQREEIRDVLRPVYLAVQGINIAHGLGLARPEDRILFIYTRTVSNEEPKLTVIKTENVMVHQMIEVIREEAHRVMFPPIKDPLFEGASFLEKVKEFFRGLFGALLLVGVASAWW